jgi:hypothetical protein
VSQAPRPTPAIVSVGVRWRPRLIILWTLIGILTVFLFETGVHSVHHIGSRSGDDTVCSVALAAGHLAGAPVETATVNRVVLVSSELAAIERVGAPALRPLSVHRSRAPPFAT